MNIIQNIQQYIFGNKQNKVAESCHVGSLELKLTKDCDIDLFCLMPDINNKTPEEMILLAENYAKFLMYISDGHLLKNDIINFLREKASETRDPEYKLLLDNIMIFWDIYAKEYKKRLKSNIKDDLPLIRPISVFSNK